MAIKYAKDQPEGFTNRVKDVAIVGGAGQMGSHLVKGLLQKGGFNVTVISRPNSSSKLPDGVKVARVDYSGDDDTALVDALRGQQALLVTMAVTAPRDSVPKLIRAAAKAGVPYILPNWFGQDSANDALCRDSMLIERRDAFVGEIRRLGVSAYLMLHCNFWFEFSLAGGPDRFGFDFPKRRLVWFDDGENKMNTTTWPQCGRAVAALLALKQLPDDEHDRSPTLAQFANGGPYVSSFLVSQRDIFESVKRVTETGEGDWDISRESSRERWSKATAAIKAGNYGAYVTMLYSRIYFPGGGSDYETKRGLDNELLGLPVEDLDEWVAEAIRMANNGEVEYSHWRDDMATEQ